MMTDRLLDALHSIDPSSLSYEEWLHIGMALKYEGAPFSAWDDWSRSDSRYHAGEMRSKWNSFEGTGITGATIVQHAKQNGWTGVRSLDWDDPLEGDYYEEVLTRESKEEQPYQMAIRYLEALFTPDESVSFVHSAKFKEEQQKWVPADAGCVRKVSAIIRDLKKYKNLDAFGTINEEAGAWIRHNPTTGANDKDVTRYAYVLVESDNLSMEDQKKLLLNLKLPIAAMLESGGKSVHAIVKIQAEDLAEYKQRVNFLFDFLQKHQFIVDQANKNPARLSRLPGAMRGGNCQKLLAVNVGCADWKDWKDYVDSIDDDLPQLDNLFDMVKEQPELSPELIGGILREGNKMIITGESKAGKTCLSQNLAVCIAEGKPWLGKFKCEQGRVLYINLEVERASLFQRFKAIYESMGIKVTENAKNIVPWNLRGYAVPLDQLAPKIIRRCRETGPYKAIILDPLYKVQQGDENSAEAIIKFCNAMDKVAHETGAAVIYDHHHPKGWAGNRKLTDRGSGSGVFSRDADAICDISALDPDDSILEVIGQQIADGEKPMQMAFVLRDFKDIAPFNIWFKFPLHYIDAAGLLKGAFVEGSREAELAKHNPNKKTPSQKEQIIEQAYAAADRGGSARISDMGEYSEVSIKTLREYIKSSPNFTIDKGVVKRTED